jgi:hypothetical protein
VQLALPGVRLVVATNSGHDIPHEQPKLILDAIHDVVLAVRAPWFPTDERLPFPARSVATPPRVAVPAVFPSRSGQGSHDDGTEHLSGSLPGGCTTQVRQGWRLCFESLLGRSRCTCEG